MEKLRKACGRVVDLLMALLFLVAAVTMGLRLMGYRMYNVVSGSMEPTIPTWSIVCSNTNNRTPRTGDIVTYDLGNGTVIVHRVIREENGMYTTKGDANAIEDLKPVSPDQILGVCTWHIPALGWIVEHAREAFCPLAILLIALLIISSTRASWEKSGT